MGKIRVSNCEYFSGPFESVVTNALFLPERRSRVKDKISSHNDADPAPTAPTGPRVSTINQQGKNFFTIAADFHGKLYVFENKHIDAH